MKLTHYLLGIVLITLVAWGSIFFTVISQDHKISTLTIYQNTLLSQHTSTINAIKSDQYTNATTLEAFIRNGLVCVTVNPLPIPATNAQIVAEGQKCFPNSRQVK